MKRTKIYFDETLHKYTDEEGSIYTSSTQLIGKVEPKYDSEFWAMYRALDQTGYKLRPDLATRRIHCRWDGFDGRYFTLDELYGNVLRLVKAPSLIRKEWKEDADAACEKGNIKHNYLEDCVKAFYQKHDYAYTSNLESKDLDSLTFRFRISDEHELKNSPLAESDPKVFVILVSLIRQGFVLYAEKRVYSYEHKISGTIDILAVKGTEFVIVDWKTNKHKLMFESGYFKKVWNPERTQKIKTKNWVSTNETFLHPLKHVPLSKGMIYTLQLSLYAYLCELWGLTCKRLILVHFLDDNNPTIYPDIVYRKDDIKKLFQWHVDTNIKKLPSRRRRTAM